MQLEAELTKSLSKYLHHNKTSDNGPPPKIEDIHIDAEVIGDMSMESVIKIALKASKPNSKVNRL